jgi:hypothetical protein
MGRNDVMTTFGSCFLSAVLGSGRYTPGNDSRRSRVRFCLWGLSCGRYTTNTPHRFRYSGVGLLRTVRTYVTRRGCELDEIEFSGDGIFHMRHTSRRDRGMPTATTNACQRNDGLALSFRQKCFESRILHSALHCWFLGLSSRRHDG